MYRNDKFDFGADEMKNEIIIALLGVLGTLGGTVLGWFLNALSQKGKLNIFVTSWKDKFEYNSVGSMVSSSSIEQTKYYEYNVSLDLYNSSGETKIMRDISICFYDKEKELCKTIPKNLATRRTSGAVTFYDELLTVNIPAKAIIHIELLNGFWDSDEKSLDFIWNTNRVVLVYTDENNKKKEVLLNKEEYKNYFQNHMIAN